MKSRLPSDMQEGDSPHSPCSKQTKKIKEQTRLLRRVPLFRQKPPASVPQASELPHLWIRDLAIAAEDAYANLSVSGQKLRQVLDGQDFGFGEMRQTPLQFDRTESVDDGLVNAPGDGQNKRGGVGIVGARRGRRMLPGDGLRCA